jgi:translation initiation factor IF-3
MLGVMSVSEGIVEAEKAGLDLVEVSPNADIPVCKILDFGKYKYEQQKKAAEARKKQKTVDIKEIKLRPNIEDHDYGVKLKAAKKFLGNEDKVKVTLRFRGREMAHKEMAAKLLDRMRDDLAELSKVEFAPKMEGRQMIMILAYDKTAAERVAKQRALEAKKAEAEQTEENQED